MRKTSVQSLKAISSSFGELFASKKMVQITLIQSVGWIAAAIILQGPSSYTSTGKNFIITHVQFRMNKLYKAMI